ncbi:gliding motility-associated C-terminal domain-containing protein, partial [Pontibacter toksunensis]
AVTLKGTYDQSTSKWAVGALANNESAVLTLVFTITKPGTLVNGVTVVADNTDPVPGDNSSEAPIDVPCAAFNVAVTGNATVCAGEEKTYTTPVNPTASAYNWSLPAGWEILSGKGTNSITVRVGATTGDVAVTVVNLCGNSKSASLAVTVNDKLAAPAITGTAGACIGERLTYTIPAVTGATGYTWTVPATWRLVSGQNTTSITVEVGAEAGQVTLGVVNGCGTGTAATLNVAPVLAPTETNSIEGNAAVCEYGETVTYKMATIEEGVTYTWSVPADWTIVAGQGTGTITVNSTATAGSISVVATNVCGTAERVSKDIQVTVPLVAVGAISDNSSVCDGLTYSIMALQGASSYLWTVPEGFTITSGQGTIAIKIKADKPTASGEVTVAALNGINSACVGVVTSAVIDASLADGQLNFPKAFSPNGDGKNDTWTIGNLEKFTENEVVIFNRWGSEVYKVRNYQNDWSASKLEQGTYFYKVRVTVCDGVVKEFTGYTTLFR